MSFLSEVYEVLLGLLHPWVFMGLSASWIPHTIKTLFQNRNFDILFSPTRFQDAWFGNFWGWAGPNVKLSAEAKVIPLLEGRTKGGRILNESTGPGIEGVCIEIGAGSGLWVDIFADKHIDAAAMKGGNRKKVTQVYGVEPNRDQHVSLRKKITEAGLEDVYEVVPVGIEDLNNPTKWGGRVEKESVDCIVSILCLCSIPDPQKNLKELHSYLKKGGRWYLYEHVRVDHSWGLIIYQAFVNLIWPRFIGGCQLCRPTEQWLREAGPWDKIDVAQPVDAVWFEVLPHILGVYTK